ncbi:MAG: TraB/GumN family protein [Lysobacteraceae bacterium]
MSKRCLRTYPFALVFLLLAGPALAAPPVVAEAADVPMLETLVVSGEQPGPGLWKVSRDGNVMWVLGTLSPLPKRMEWNPDEASERIAASSLVLLSPRVSIKTRGGALGGMFLLPSALRARNNPDRQQLEDVLPSADYARWQVLKARYLGRDRGVEKRRPIAAAMELREEAFDRSDLSWRDVVGREVKRAARRSGVPFEQPTVTLRVENARAALKEFSRNELDDLECFRLTLDQVERDLDTLATRANAWAMGEVAMLQDLPYTDNSQACTEARCRRIGRTFSRAVR